jgi:hypothetical protein
MTANNFPLFFIRVSAAQKRGGDARVTALLADG